MAIGDFRLTNTRYVRPGVYIGYVRIPRPTTDPGIIRYPCVVGRGSRLAVVSNLAHRRSYVEDEQLSFSLTPPYYATLPYPALDDKTENFLYKQDRTLVSTDKWRFTESTAGSGIFDRVEIQLTEFDRHATYYIDYQSSERDDIKDPLKFDQLRQMVLVGDTEGQNKYIEYVDYRIVTDVVGNAGGSDPDALIADATNAHITGRNTPVTATGTILGTVAHNTASTYSYAYSMRYTLYCRAIVPGASATFELVIDPLSGGNSQNDKIPEYTAFIGTRAYSVVPTGRAIEFTVAATGGVTTVSLQSAVPHWSDDIILDFDSTAGDYNVDNVFTWDSYGPGMIEISSAHDNNNQFPMATTPVEGLNYLTGAVATDSGTITISPDSAYTGTFDRHYKLQVYYPAGPGPTGTGPAGNRAFNVIWSAWDELPYTQGYFQIRENDIVNNPLLKIPLENGIYVDVNLGAGHLAQDTANAVTTGPASDLATALTMAADCKPSFNKHDVDAAHSSSVLLTGTVSVTNANPNVVGLGTDFTTELTIGDAIRIVDSGLVSRTYIVANITGATTLVLDSNYAGITEGGLNAYTGSHQMSAAIPSNESELVVFCGDLATKYTAHQNDSAMHIPIDDVFTLDDITVTDTATAIQFLNDFKEKYNRHILAVNFVEGDTWTFVARAARQDYTAKDDRLYNLTVGTVLPASLGVAWYTNTYEGSFGSFVVTPTVPYTTLTDNITLVVRNYPTTIGVQQFASNDKFSFTTIDEDLVDWSLRTRAQETIPADEVFQDVLGQVTGIPLSWYIILSDTPETVIWVRKATDQSRLSYTQVMDQGQPTPYLMLAADPGADVEVYYEHRGREPDPGNIYYISALRLRLDTEYDRPVRYLTREEMERGLGPKTSDNLIWIAGDIMFDTNFFGSYFCQVKDAAGNQVFSTADFRRAIQATEKKKDITDLVVLSFYPALAEAKASIERMADPFENAERMLWVGVPTGTQLGDIDTPDTLVYLAKKTLQFSGDNPGRGHIVLLANPTVTRTLVLDDGTVTRVDLDGSYLAAYTAALNASYRDPATTLLRKDVTAFDDMQVFNEQEELILGQNSILYCNSVGGSIFRYQESVTIDISAPDLREISAMNQKIYVTRKIVQDMDDALVSIVPPSAAAGVIIVRAFLVDDLSQMVSQGIIAPYGQEANPPTIRPINPQTDVYVFVDEIDRTLYHFGYFYNIRYPIKRLFGLYSVDTKFWDARQ